MLIINHHKKQLVVANIVVCSYAMSTPWPCVSASQAVCYGIRVHDQLGHEQKHLIWLDSNMMKYFDEDSLPRLVRLGTMQFTLTEGNFNAHYLDGAAISTRCLDDGGESHLLLATALVKKKHGGHR